MTTRFIFWNFRFLAAGILCLLLMAPPLLADEEYLWNNEAPMTRFLAAHYQVDPITVISLGQRMSYPDDVSVAIYLAKAAEISPLLLLEPRLKKKSWLSIAESLHLSPSLLFPVPGEKITVPPEFSHAWREWEKYQKSSDYTITLYDKEFRNLVQLKLVTDAFARPPQWVMDEVHSGRSFTSIIVDELRLKEEK
jgi:hypothetical protein